MPPAHISLPACPSSAYSTACVEAAILRCDCPLTGSSLPSTGFRGFGNCGAGTPGGGSTHRCSVFSPLPYPNTIPLATTGGSAIFMSRETHAGRSANLLPVCTTLNAATAPFVTGPFSMGYLYCGCFGPQNGVRTQRVPAESSQLAMEPHTPAVKLTSSLQSRGVRSRGVR